MEREIKILQEKKRFGIAKDYELEILESLLREKAQRELTLIFRPDLAEEERTRQENERAYKLYVRREELKAAKRFQRENPEIHYSLGGLPLSLFTLIE
jgi:hypothetical protein